MRRSVPFLMVAATALVLAWMLAPRPSVGIHVPSPGAAVSQAGLGLTDVPYRIRPLVIGRRRASGTALPSGTAAPQVGLGALEPEPEEANELGTGFLSGHVVDEQGFPVKHAVLHIHGAAGTLAHRTDEDGNFHVAVPEGRWTAEAGWFDGDDEWRSRPAVAEVVSGENVSLPFEILMQGAAHGVHSAIEEAAGVGWKVAQDDGPLKAGDVLVEVEGLFLADLQPESVKAALRSRPGETIAALVLRLSASGDYEEIPVVLDAR